MALRNESFVPPWRAEHRCKNLSKTGGCVSGAAGPPLWNPAVAPHPTPPAKPTLSSLASATVPQVLCFLVFLFFYFLLSLRSLMNLWTLVEKDEEAPASGLPHPQLSALTTISICSRSPSVRLLVNNAKVTVKSSLDKNAPNLRVPVITVGCQGGMWFKYTCNVLLNNCIKT